MKVFRDGLVLKIRVLECNVMEINEKTVLMLSICLASKRHCGKSRSCGTSHI